MSAQPACPLQPACATRPLPAATAGCALGSRPGSGSPSRPGPASALPVSRAWLAAALLACGLLLEALAPSVALAQARLEVPDLQCRLGGGPWQPCRMEVQDIGLRWALRIGALRVEFRHGGDGAVRMQKGAGPWQPVTATWQPDTSLCWDGVCAKGDIPLD